MSLESVETAMLMAAGRGSRLRPLTDTCPKPLIEVAGRSMIDRQLDALVADGVARAIVNVHWLADQMEDHLSRRTDIEILISDERDELLETGGGLAKARPMLGEAPVFVLNTDAFWTPAGGEPLAALRRAWNPDLMDECLLLARTDRCLGFDGPGDFFRDGSGVIARRGQAETSPYAYAGVRLMKPQQYDDRPVKRFSAVEVWEPALAADRLHGVVMDRFWLHVGDPEALNVAEAYLAAETA